MRSGFLGTEGRGAGDLDSCVLGEEGAGSLNFPENKNRGHT